MNQREIASRLGVSQSTVSLVLNNPKTAKVSREKRDLVLDFIQRNNYSSIPKNGKTKNFAYILPAETASGSHQRFYDRFIMGIEEAASLAGYNIIVEKCKKGQNLIFPTKKVDGIIIEGAIKVETLKDIAASLPTVLLNNSTCNPICDMVYADNRTGVELAMRFLEKSGHKRIAYFGARIEEYVSELNFHQRLEAFNTLVSSLELEENPDYIQLPLLAESTVAATEEKIREALLLWKKMDKPPTALLCYNDLYALQMIRQANILGIKIPADLSIIGTDNIPGSELSFPALTSIDHNAEEMGRLSVETLIRRINNPDRPVKRISCSASLVTRESVINLKKGD